MMALISCAALQKPKEKSTPRYSEETEKTFEQIERERLLEKYRKMRADAMRKGTYVKKKRTTRQHSRARQRVVKKTPVKTKQIYQSEQIDPGQLAVEIDQNRSYFCIQHEDHRRFKSGTNCEEFTAAILEECMGDYDENDRALLRCFKARISQEL